MWIMGQKSVNFESYEKKSMHKNFDDGTDGDVAGHIVLKSESYTGEKRDCDVSVRHISDQSSDNSA